MSTKPGLGKNFFNQTITRGRQATIKARQAARRIIEETPGPQTTAMLIATIALQLGVLDEVITELDNIGRTAKDLLPDK